MTVGYPGGEFAMQCDPTDRDRNAKFRAAIEDGADLIQIGGYSIRLAPPDLAEWLEWPDDAAHEFLWDQAGARTLKWKQPGGWLAITYHDNEHGTWPASAAGGEMRMACPFGTVASQFIPVRGADGITVLDGGAE